MAAETFRQAWERSCVALSAIPSLLVRDWIQEGYIKFCALDDWSFLRKESVIAIEASRSLAAVTVTNGSTTITSAGLFVAGDVGRQIRIDSRPVFTVLTNADVNTITVDRAWEDDTDTTTATILDAYTTMPEDFDRFLVIADPYQQRPGGIPFHYTEDEIARVDPNRLIGDSYIRGLVARKYSAAGLIQYELWPYPTATRGYPYLYLSEASRLADTADLPGPLAQRSDVLKLYAQYQAALWPGTRDQRNPFYNLPNAMALKKAWEDEVQHLSLADDNITPQQYLRTHWDTRGRLAGPTSLLRQTDADLSDYL